MRVIIREESWTYKLAGGELESNIRSNGLWLH